MRRSHALLSSVERWSLISWWLSRYTLVDTVQTSDAEVCAFFQVACCLCLCAAVPLFCDKNVIGPISSASTNIHASQVLASHHATVVRVFAFINGYGGELGGQLVDATPVPIQASSSPLCCPALMLCCFTLLI